MAKFDPVALHPLDGPPYDKLHFVRLNPQRVPLYTVAGSPSAAAGAERALARAFALYGGACFYCGKTFKPQPLSPRGAHRDHVVAQSCGGSDRLHNLVIACSPCGSKKADRPLEDFQPPAATKYSAALERHIARALGAASPKASALPRPKPAAAAGP